MVLRGEIEEICGLAGAKYARLWRSYVVTLAAPRALTVTAGGFLPCAGCPAPRGCPCERRRDDWDAARTALADTGCTVVVDNVALEDRALGRDYRFMLETGLWALAHHFGLTRVGKGVVGNRGSKKF